MKRVVAENGVVYYRSEIIPCPHGFSTRIGGVSTLPYTESLNLGFERDDSRKTVLENLKLFSEAVGIEVQQIVSCPQIHSDRIRVVSEREAGEGIFREAAEACDGYLTESSCVAPAVRTADCVPILIYAPAHGDFCGAVSALHAGWRGTAAKIAPKAVGKLVEMGANPTTLRMAIGPSIDACCYEVREDFKETFFELLGEDFAKQYLIPLSESNGQYRVDLRAVNKALLLTCGIAPSQIDCFEGCTCCMQEEFYSHRAMGEKRGSLLSVIRLAHEG